MNCMAKISSVWYHAGMKHLSESELEALRDALLTEQSSLREELAMYGKQDVTTGEWSGSSADETTMEEADPTDAADQIEELLTNVPLVADLQKRAHEVDDALDRMEKGTYGTCEVSGEEIPLERLEANPAAKTCIAHA
jgi:RNA polymerase-binding protein DksA